MIRFGRWFYGRMPFLPPTLPIYPGLGPAPGLYPSGWVRIKVINELLYLIWDVMIFQNSRNEIVMDLPKSIFEIKKCNHNRPLFHAGFVDDMCHMGCMFERTRKFRHKTFLNTMLYIPVSG